MTPASSEAAAPPNTRGPRRIALVEAWRDRSLGGFRRDLVAGLVVGVVALPLSLAFAIASGADPRAGLVTAVVAGAIAALVGGSRVAITGPTGAFVVILYAIGLEFGFAKLVVATMLAGALLLLAGMFRLGGFIKFIPYPVTTGFTAGIAVVIAVAQLQDVLGLRLSGLPGAPIERLAAIAPHLDAVSLPSVALAMGTIGIIQGVKRVWPLVPGPVVALLLLTVAAHLAGWPVATIGDRYGALPRGFPVPSIPDLDLHTVRQMMPSAITIALLGGIESLLACVVADGVTGDRHDSDQELVGQGLANIGSALFGGLAATGAIARTATNVQMGGRSPLAALVHSGVVLMVLLFAAPWASLIPMPVLAGILLVVAWNMSERHRFRRLLRMPRSDAGVMIVVFLVTVIVDLTVAVTIGIVLSGAFFLHRMGEATGVARVDPLRDEAPAPHRFQPEDVPPGVVVYSVTGPFFFAAADRFQETLGRIADTPSCVVLRLRDVRYLDATAINALETVISRLKKRGVDVYLAGVQPQAMDALTRSGTLALVGNGSIFDTTKEALEAARRSPSAL